MAHIEVKYSSSTCPRMSCPALLSRGERSLILVPSTSQALGSEAKKRHKTHRTNLRCCCAHQQTTAAVHAEEAANDTSFSSLFPEDLRYKRVMLKVSGEALQGGFVAGIDPKVLQGVAREVATAAKRGVQIAVVVGGGNYFRGANAWAGLERATADYVGMLATCMNAIMLQSAIEKMGIEVRVQTAIEMREIAEPYIRRRAIRHLERGRVVIFGAGTGNPFMTTDTAAALRAAEIDAEALLKATKVDGVFDCDPATNEFAKLHRQISFRQVMLDDLKVMDETAITLCKENEIKVVVFNLTTPGNIIRALLGDPDIGTTVSGSLDRSDEEETFEWSAAGNSDVRIEQVIEQQKKLLFK